MGIFFTADPHLDHISIIESCHRPYANLAEMETAFITNWNNVVTEKDDVYLQGDVFWRTMSRKQALAVRSKLKGNIHLISGNHDDIAKSIPQAWCWVKSEYELKLPDFYAFLTHYPMRSWLGSNQGSINLHGHSHGNLTHIPGSRQIDVGVDCWSMTPVSIEQIKARVAEIDAEITADNLRIVEYDAPPTESELRDLIRHMWKHDGFEANGHRFMTHRQRDVFREVTHGRSI